SLFKGVDVHILAYNFNPKNQELLDILKSIQKGRYIRAEKIIKKLKKMGINVQMSRVLDITGNNNLIGRPHIARVMVENGNCKSVNEAFVNFLSENSPAYVLKPTPSIDKVIKIIKNAGGISVLAHPHTLCNDDYIYDFIKLGLDGIEAYYAKYTTEKVQHYNEIALKNGLIRTGGSDFHGHINDFNFMGNYSAPEFVLDEILKSK
ncbi:MAG: hypothetical protein DRJ01_12785, partial [Bacteroidetes bacterium]